MSKKQIIILIVVGLVMFISTFLGVYFLTNDKESSSSNKKQDSAIVLKDYKLQYGTYVGEESEYNPDTKKTETKKVKIKVTKDKINDQEYIVKGNSIYIKSNGKEIEMYEVTADNAFTLLAGSGIEYKLEK